MISLNDMFNKISVDQCKSVINHYGIEIPKQYLFSDINIVIGKNGSGKTRLLNSIRSLAKLNGNKTVYCYFPKMSSSIKNADTNEEELPQATLSDAAGDNSIEFEDFLKAIQDQHDSYLRELLKHRSLAQRKKHEKSIEVIKDYFSQLTGYTLDYANGCFSVIKNGKTESLTKAIELFSPGERLLYYLAIFASLQIDDNQVIILDEPETHLHPSALLSFLKLIKNINKHSTLWIATHSLFVIPEFEFENIVYMDCSAVVSRSSNLFHQLLEGMIGKEYQETNKFLSSLDQWAYAGFMSECFTNPTVIDTVNPNDEQVKLFVEFITKHHILDVLDYGGGEARLGRSYQMLAQSDNSVRKVNCDIYNIEKGKEYSGFQYYYENASLPKNKYDCVVMMNVLHEIEPIKWEKSFLKISSALKRNGYLLFVETSILSKGEMPHKDGYLVLSKSELEVLFNAKGKLSEIKLKDGQKSVCILVHAKYLKNICNTTIYSAIELLEQSAYSKLIQERKGNNRGRKYAFYTQLYINAKIFNDRVIALKRGDDPDNMLPRALEREKLLLSLSSFFRNIIPKSYEELRLISLIKGVLKDNKDIAVVDNDIVALIWASIITLKDKDNKELISASLLALILFDHKKSIDMFKQGKYERNLPKVIVKEKNQYKSFI